MVVTWDEAAGAMYLATGEEARAAARTVELDSGTLVDLDDFDMVVGVEVINPRRPLPVERIMAMHIRDEDRALLFDYLQALSSPIVQVSGAPTRVEVRRGPVVGTG